MSQISIFVMEDGQGLSHYAQSVRDLDDPSIA